MAKQQPLMVRTLSGEERTTLEIFAQSNGCSSFTGRRSRILLTSSQGKAPLQIATDLGVDDETVRRAIRAFNERGMPVLIEGSPKPKCPRELFIAGGREALLAIFHRNPTHYGFDSGNWTLELIADAAFAEGITTSRVSDETIRSALVRHGIKWSHFKRLLRRECHTIPSANRRIITIQQR
ncbi:MAG: helix-turn-helix domain-containing protein [Chloroflexales bacterium]